MKKVIKNLALLFLFLLPTVLLFTSCGGDPEVDEMTGFIVTPKSSALVVNEYNEINLEHGQVYNIDVNSFRFYEAYANSQKEITDISKISFKSFNKLIVVIITTSGFNSLNLASAFAASSIITFLDIKHLLL